MDLLPLFASVMVKGTVALAVAWLAAALLRGRSAAVRHVVWTAAFAVLTILPLAVFLLPSAASVEVAPASPLRALNPVEEVYEQPASTWITHPASLYGFPLYGRQTPRLRAGAPIRNSPDYRGMVVWIWLGGAALVAVRVAAAMVSLGRLRRTARQLDAGLAADLAGLIGLRRPVQLLEVADSVTPMSWGFLRPVVFLPESAREWTGERLRLALLHELFHIRRRDTERQLLANAACALFWCHPLAWMARREFLKAREQATDDLVLLAGVGAARYAEDLLQIATAMRPADSHACVTVAMARSSQIAGRLRAILDSAVDRRAAGRAAIALAAVSAVAALTLLGLRIQAPTGSVHLSFGRTPLAVPKWSVEVEGEWPQYLSVPHTQGCGNNFAILNSKQFARLTSTPAAGLQAQGPSQAPWVLPCKTTADPDSPIRLFVSFGSGNPLHTKIAEVTLRPGEAVTIPELTRYRWPPLRMRIVPNREPRPLRFHTVSWAPSLKIEKVEETRQAFMVTVKNSSGRAVTLATMNVWGYGDTLQRESLQQSPPGVAIEPHGESTFEIPKFRFGPSKFGRGYAILPHEPSPDPWMILTGAAFSGAALEGPDADAVIARAQADYETRILQGRSILAELRRRTSWGRGITAQRVMDAISEAPLVTAPAVAARVRDPEFVTATRVGMFVEYTRQAMITNLGDCARAEQEYHSAKGAARCVEEYEKAYARY